MTVPLSATSGGSVWARECCGAAQLASKLPSHNAFHGGIQTKTCVAVYKQFEDHWKDEFQVKYGNIPAATQFKAQITAIDGIHYLAGQNNRRTGPWTGQKNPYVGVRLKTQPTVAPAAAAAAAAAARAGGQ